MRSLMIKTTIMSFLACVTMTAALAEDAQDVVTNGSSNEPVRGEKFGNCVETKWSVANSPCAPAPVVEAPVAPRRVARQQPVTKLAHEQLTIYFAFNKSALTKESKEKLDTIAAAVNHSPRVTKVGIVGFTDAIGTDGYNNALSIKRANVVKEYLDTKTKIDTSVLGLRGLGKQSPVTKGCNKIKNHTKKVACLAKDRRVEIEFQFRK